MAAANSSPTLNLQDCRVECRTYARPARHLLAWMRTKEPTASGLSTSTSTPDALTLSTWPKIVLQLPAPASQKSLAQHRIGMRCETLGSDPVISSAVSFSGCASVVQERLIYRPDRIPLAITFGQINCHPAPRYAQSGEAPKVSRFSISTATW
jgi:hypothetical protein